MRWSSLAVFGVVIGLPINADVAVAQTSAVGSAVRECLLDATQNGRFEKLRWADSSGSYMFHYCAGKLAENLWEQLRVFSPESTPYKDQRNATLVNVQNGSIMCVRRVKNADGSVANDLTCQFILNADQSLLAAM